MRNIAMNSREEHLMTLLDKVIFYLDSDQDLRERIKIKDGDDAMTLHELLGYIKEKLEL